MWQDELFDEIQKGDTVYYENQQGQNSQGQGRDDEANGLDM